jgi:glycosyltransferase involved in cell wall biosynthesis
MRPRVLELRSVRGTGGGPDKTIILSASPRYSPRYETFVAYIRDPSDRGFRLRDRAAEAGVELLEIDERWALDWRIWPALRDLVLSREISIVHAHDYKTDLLAYLLGRRRYAIPVATAHGWSGHSWREERVYYPIDKRILGRFPHVIAVSPDVRTALVNAGAAADRVSVILNGIDAERFIRRPAEEQPARRYYHIDSGKLVVGAVGRLEPEKNFPLLVQAFAEVARHCPGALLMIAGEGSDRPRIEQEIQSHRLGMTVRLVGSEANIIRFHHALDVFVQSSDNEGAPNAVLEAMALRTPIVATAVGGTGDLVRHGLDGILVPRRDERALAEGIISCIAGQEAARDRAASARLRIETELSFDKRLRRVETIYDRLLDECAIGTLRGRRKFA